MLANAIQGDPHDALRASVDQLYVAFAAYDLPSPVTWCRCCISEEEEARIVATPMRQLSTDVIKPFAEHTLMTCGGGADFKHFLPRIFELLVEHPEIAVEPEFLMERMVGEGRWFEFPDAERAAIDRWLEASWRYTLSAPPWPHCESWCRQGRWLSVLVKASRVAARWLEIWERAWTIDQRALIAFAEFVLDNQPYLQRGTLSGYYETPDNALVREIVEWVVRREHADRLDDYVLTTTETAAGVCEEAATILRRFNPA